MRTTVLVSLLCSVCIACAGSNWTHRAAEGEDASSAHFYFYQSNGESIQRVRWVWNGGAQNSPTVSEYVLGVGKITIRQGQAKRENLNALVSGDDVAVRWTNEYSISTQAGDGMLLPMAAAAELTDEQRKDLKNLIDLLAKERKPCDIRALQSGAAENNDSSPEGQ